MAAPGCSFKQVLAMIVIFLVSLASAAADPTIHHVVAMSTQVRVPRRILLEMPERQAPRGFPPPQGNAFFTTPNKFPPPGKPSFDDVPDGRPPARLPENARRLAPPPHP